MSDLVSFLLGEGLIYTIGGVVVALTILLYLATSSSKNSNAKNEDESNKTSNQTKPKEETNINKNKSSLSKLPKKEEKMEDPLKYGALKGHTGEITGCAYSPDGKFIATIATDRTLRVFEANTIKEKAPKFIRIALPLDHAIAVTFSADSRHVIMALGNSQDIIAYKISTKKNEEGRQYKEVYRFTTNKQHPNQILTLAISSNSKIILTCSEDTTFHLWGLKGKHLTSVNSNQMKNNMACISPDSRFLMVAAWTGDIKIWEINYQKETGDFDKVTKAMELKGHKGNVSCVSFSSDGKRVVSCSKDGTWRLWKIDVRYHIGEDAQNIVTVQCPVEKKAFQLISISPDSKTVLATIDRSLYFYSVADQKVVGTVDSIRDEPKSLAWSADSTNVVIAGLSTVTVWKNPMKN